MEGFKSCGVVMFAHAPEHWGSAPEDWERSAAEHRRSMESTIARVRAAGWGDACAGQAVRDVLENIEICSINVEPLNRTGSFDDPAWIERRSLAARTRLEATTDPVLLPGYRKIVRKWNEEIMQFQMTMRVKSRMACAIEKTSTRPDDRSVTTVSSAFEGTAALAPAGGRIRTALGLQPELAVARERELPLFEKLLSRTSYVGEVGLDGSPSHRATLDRQSAVLVEILKMCGRAGGRIVSLHSRGATGPLLDRLAAVPSAGTFILHWYLGGAKQIARATEMQCWFSVGPAMLASARGIAAVAAMPRDWVLPESDGPFGLLAGRPAYPWEAWSITSKLVELWGESQGDVEMRLFDNFRRLASHKSFHPT
jgi:TatD DNase family protein